MCQYTTPTISELLLSLSNNIVLHNIVQPYSLTLLLLIIIIIIFI